MNTYQNAQWRACSISMLFICLVLAGCAAPIRSRIESAEGQSVGEGFRYYLTKTNVGVTVRARLDECGDRTDPKEMPVVTVLVPNVVAKPAADRSFAYWVSPKDAWNLFRSIDSAELTLTEDGRVATASAKVTDKTVEVLAEFVKFGSGLRTVSLRSKLRDGFDTAQQLPEIVTKRSVSRCTDRARIVDDKRKNARTGLSDLLNVRASVLSSGAAAEGTRETIAVLDEAIAKQNALIAQFDDALTRSITLWLSPTPQIDKFVSPREEIEIEAGWIEGGSGEKLSVVAEISRKSVASLMPSEDLTRDVSGVMYRVPPGGVPVFTKVSRGKVGSQNVRVDVEEFDPLATSTISNDSQLRVNSEYLHESNPVRVMQWGRLAVMPSDVGWLTSNSVKTTFDEWGVPKTSSWSATPATIPGLLGIVNQADAAFARKPAAAANPVAEQQTEVYLRLLQICKDAPPNAVPSFCASLVK